MPVWPLYVITAILFYRYGLPLIEVLCALRRTAVEFSRLDSQRFRVIRNVGIRNPRYQPQFDVEPGAGASRLRNPAKATCKADYVVVSIHGVFAFNILNLGRGWSSLYGNENDRTWRHTLHTRIYLPMVGTSGMEEVREVHNPLIASREFLSEIAERLPLSNRKNVMIPGAVIVPKLAGATIRREPDSNAVIAYPRAISRVLSEYDQQVLSREEIDSIYDRIVLLSKEWQRQSRGASHHKAHSRPTDSSIDS